VTKLTARFSGNQDIIGVGIVNTGASLLSRSHVHALMHIGVHDGRTFAILKSGGAVPPTRQLDDFKWPESPEAVNTPGVRAVARALLAEALDKEVAGSACSVKRHASLEFGAATCRRARARRPGTLRLVARQQRQPLLTTAPPAATAGPLRLASCATKRSASAAMSSGAWMTSRSSAQR
jgi:hypothetical protein